MAGVRSAQPVSSQFTLNASPADCLAARCASSAARFSSMKLRFRGTLRQRKHDVILGRNIQKQAPRISIGQLNGKNESSLEGTST
jgi:hypothetical protein